MSALTSRDVARLAGVSQSTVSYVMSGKRPISENTRGKVLAAIEQLTYQPNAGARALASQRTSVIGLVVPFGPGADTAGILPFIESIALSARQRDHEVLLVTSGEGSDGLRRLAGRKLCDAIVLMDIRRIDERVAVGAELRVPIVLIGMPKDTAGLHCVDVDFPMAARLAVDELAATGHDRILLIGHPAEAISQDLNFVRRFADAAEEAADRHGIAFEQVAPVEWGRAGARDAVEPERGTRSSVCSLVGSRANASAYLCPILSQCSRCCTPWPHGASCPAATCPSSLSSRTWARTRRSHPSPTSRSSLATSRGVRWRRSSGCWTRPTGRSRGLDRAGGTPPGASRERIVRKSIRIDMGESHDVQPQC